MPNGTGRYRAVINFGLARRIRCSAPRDFRLQGDARLIFRSAIRGSYGGMIGQLEDELREYDQVKSGELTLPHVERLDQIALFIAKVREFFGKRA
jgi:hypothetical protein